MNPQNIVVALDGSRRAIRAILPARRLAAALGLPVGVITVDDGKVRVDPAELESIRADNRLHWSEAVRSSSVSEGILECARERRAIVVMTTAGRGRSLAVVGSTASTVAENARYPVMLVGPGTEVSERRPIEELVVAVSGTVDGESICQPAIELADADRFAVHFVTVVEADSEPTDPRSAGASRRFGPAGDEHAYIADLTRRHERPGVRVEGSVIHDPLSPASGLARMMRRRPQSILVLGSTARTGLARLRHGSVAGRIIAESPAPAIVVASPVEASALSA